MADIKSKYGAATAITITAGTLASSNTAGQSSTAIDNTTDLFIDALVEVAPTLSATAPANDKNVYVYAYGSVDGTNYTDAISGTDAAYTFRVPTHLRLIGVIPTAAASAAYRSMPMSVAAAFGGVLPPKWGIVIKNYTGSAFTAFSAQYRGVLAQSV